MPQTNGYPFDLAGFASSMDETLYDALAALIQRIYIDQYAGRIHTVMLAATDIRSGVSYLASCMATVLAQTLGPTVLVDAQVLPRLASEGMRPRRLNCTHIDGGQLWYLGAAEAKSMTSASPVDSTSLAPVLRSLTDDFDYVIVDAPALNISKLVEAIAPVIDGIVLVAVKDKSEVRDLEKARSRLTTCGGTLLGSLYNTKLADNRNGETR